jgi:trypsin-like peptidase
MRRLKSLAILHCAVAGSLAVCVLPASPQNVQSVAATAIRSVCVVFAERGNETVTGTGFIVADGFVLTSHHVVQGADHVRVLCPDHPATEVTFFKADADNDMALLHNTVLAIRSLPLGESAKVQVGQEIVVIGFPRADLLGADTVTVTQGTVSSVQAGALQIQAPVGPGNSGSPVLTLRGQVIGLVRAVLGSQLGTNFVTSFVAGIDAAKPFLTSALGGLYGSANVGNPPPVPQPPKPAARSSNFVITPGRSIGDLALGMHQNEIQTLLGPPKQGGYGNGGSYMNWFERYATNSDPRGLWAVFSSVSSDEAIMIGVLNDPRYLTVQGLHSGSREDDVRAALGKPSRAVTQPNNKLLYYDSIGLRFTIANNRTWGIYGLVHEIAVYRR